MGCGANADVVACGAKADVAGCCPNTDVAGCCPNADGAALVFVLEKALGAAFVPDPKAETDEFPVDPKAEPPPKTDPLAPCGCAGAPNAEEALCAGAPKADDALCAGAGFPNTEGVVDADRLPKADWPKTDPPDGADDALVLFVGAAADAPIPNAEGWPENAEKPPPPEPPPPPPPNADWPEADEPPNAVAGFTRDDCGVDV